MKVITIIVSSFLATLSSSSPVPEPECKCDITCSPDTVCLVVPGECRSVCVEPVFCGGIVSIPCPEEMDVNKGNTTICVDDPRDNCDPDGSGVDCGGLCLTYTPAPLPTFD